MRTCGKSSDNNICCLRLVPQHPPKRISACTTQSPRMFRDTARTNQGKCISTGYAFSTSSKLPPSIKVAV